MSAPNPSIEVGKTRVSPIVVILGATVGISLLMLLLPSSKQKNLATAKEVLMTTFAGPDRSTFRGLIGQKVVQGKKLVEWTPRFQGHFIIFVPDKTNPIPYDFPSSALNAPFVAARSSIYGTQSSVLLAPDPSMTEWTLFSKIWLASCIENSNKIQLQALADSIKSGSANAKKNLKTEWAMFSPSVQKQAEDLLKTNIAIAKSFGKYRNFYLDASGRTFEIPESENIYMFQTYYEQVYETNPQSDR